MSETYTPEPIDPSDFDSDNVAESDAQETPRRANLKARLARKLMSVTSAEQQQKELNATIDRMTAPERDLDNLITDDLEILGQSGHLRRDMRDGTKDVMNAADSKLVTLRQINPASKLRDTYLSYRKDRLSDKVQRLERLVNHNPDSLVNKRRHKKLAMLRSRQKMFERKLARRQTKGHALSTKLQTRIEKRDKWFQEQIDKYIADKVEAMRRKEQRKLLKSEGVSKLNPAERARFIANLPTETKKRLTREAILAVREENIRKGKLDWTHEVDSEKDKRNVGTYERTT